MCSQFFRLIRIHSRLCRDHKTIPRQPDRSRTSTFTLSARLGFRTHDSWPTERNKWSKARLLSIFNHLRALHCRCWCVSKHGLLMHLPFLRRHIRRFSHGSWRRLSGRYLVGGNKSASIWYLHLNAVLGPSYGVNTLRPSLLCPL